MSNVDKLKLVMDAIDAVKAEAIQAEKDHDPAKLSESLNNLLGLENCLVTEVKAFLKREECSGMIELLKNS